MKITAIDDANDLWLVEDIFDPKLLENIPLDLPWEDIDPRQEPGRRQIGAWAVDKDHPFAQMQEHTQSMERYWSQFFGELTMVQKSRVWWDGCKFMMKEHVDGSLSQSARKNEHYNPQAAMQIYLTEGQGQAGTTFYNPDMSVRHTFPYKINTGYVMRNHRGQLHGVLGGNSNQRRLSLYVGFQFEIKENQ